MDNTLNHSIVIAQDNDCERWNSFVRLNVNSTIFHYFEWKSILEKNYKIKTFYLMKMEHGQIAGILPLGLAPKLFGKKLISLPYCDICGPVANSEKIATELINYALDFARKINSEVEIRTEDLDKKSTDKKYVLQKVKVTPEIINMTSLDSNLRRKIRKAQKNNLKVERGLHNLDCFYSVYEKNMHYLGTPAHSKKYIKDIVDQLKNESQIITIFKENVPIGSMLVIKQGETAKDPWTSTLREYNHLYTSSLLYFEALKYAYEQKLSIFDFGRSTYGSGTYKFKQQWNTEDVPLVYWGTKNNSTYDKKMHLNLVSKVWRKIPFFIIRFIGSKLRRYLH